MIGFHLYAAPVRAESILKIMTSDDSTLFELTEIFTEDVVGSGAGKAKWGAAAAVGGTFYAFPRGYALDQPVTCGPPTETQIDCDDPDVRGESVTALAVTIEVSLYRGHANFCSSCLFMC